MSLKNGKKCRQWRSSWGNCENCKKIWQCTYGNVWKDQSNFQTSSAVSYFFQLHAQHYTSRINVKLRNVPKYTPIAFLLKILDMSGVRWKTYLDFLVKFSPSFMAFYLDCFKMISGEKVRKWESEIENLPKKLLLRATLLFAPSWLYICTTLKV